MKYIRTKDGAIIKGTLNYKDEDFYIDRQSDTIEELCDEFVYISNFRKWLQPQHQLTGVYLFNKEEKMIAIYGAVWTDKGLIYVAKVNEKGELCLI